jgi:hypothetical protein
VASKPIAGREVPPKVPSRHDTRAESPAAGVSSRIWVAAEAALVLAGFTALAVWLTWPLATDLNGSIYGYPGDATGTIALLWSLADKTGYHVLGTSHISLTGAPIGWSYPNGLNVQWAAVFVPGVLATKLFGEVVAYNLIVLSGLALSGPAMYLLVRRLGAPPPVAAWAGLAYTIFPWHLEKAQGHAGFVHLEGFPLLVLAVLAWHRRPTPLRALLVAAASLFLWTTAGYFGVIGSVTLAVLLPIVALFHSRRFGTRRALGRLALAGSLALAVPLAVYASSSIGSGSGVGGARSAGDLFLYGARPWEYVLPSYRNRFFGDDVGNWLFGHLHGSNFSETSLYVGWLTILLALGWLVWALLRRRQLRSDEAFLAVALPALIVVAGLFSLPSPLPRTNVPMPARLLWEVAPQFRVPSRFVVAVMTGLVCLAALGLTGLWHFVVWAVRRPGVARPLVIGLCAVAAAISLVELPIEASPATTDVSVLPRYYRAVEAASPGILAEYPLAQADQAVNSDYLFWQRRHGRRLVNGAQPDTFADAVGQALVDPASPEVPSALAMLGVSVAVVRPNTYSYSGGRAAPARLPPGYRLLGRFGDTSVWRVIARPAPAIAAFRDGFGHVETPPGIKSAWRWLDSPHGVVELDVQRPGTYLARFQINSYGRTRIVRIGGRNDFRLFAVSNPRTVSFPVRLERGPSHFVLDVRPGPATLPSGQRVAVYVSDWQFLPLRGRPAMSPLEPLPGGPD